MILNAFNGKTFDLSKSSKFMAFKDKSYSFSTHILNQINSGKFSNIKPGKLAVDIGANVGLVSILLSTMFENVVSVEPTPEHLEVFWDLLYSLGITNVIIVPKAVYTTDGKVTFNTGNTNSTMNSIVECNQNKNGKITVDSISLKTLLVNYESVDLLKLDIEGGEMLLFKDEEFRNTLQQKVRAAIIEAHSFPDLNPVSIHNNAIKIGDNLSTLDFGVTLNGVDEIVAVNRSDALAPTP